MSEYQRRPLNTKLPNTKIRLSEYQSKHSYIRLLDTKIRLLKCQSIVIYIKINQRGFLSFPNENIIYIYICNGIINAPRKYNHILSLLEINEQALSKTQPYIVTSTESTRNTPRNPAT